jgi:lipid A 3-O-deacylase
MKIFQSCILFCLLVISCLQLNAQLIEHSTILRTVNAEKFFRFHYDNDYFTKSDEYYSQGVGFELVMPGLKKFPISRLLWQPLDVPAQFGIMLHSFGYTPTTISRDEILYGDRPFSASINLKTFSIQSDPVKHQQISAAFTIGVIGPLAFGKEMQTGIHRALNNKIPQGWQHQIHNDIVLNYQLNYEKQLLSVQNTFSLNSTSEIRLGTLNTKLNTGLNFMAGWFNNRYTPVSNKKRKFEIYVFGQGRVNLVGYDASLQGGFFNKNSPYTISRHDISPAVFQADGGLIVNFRNIYLSYTQSFLTREFKTGKTHRWGGVSIGFQL